MTGRAYIITGRPPALLVGCDLARELETLVYAHRRSLGLSELRQHRVLVTAASVHSERMRRLGFFDHHDPYSGTEPWHRVRHVERRTWTIVSENIAAGQWTARQVFDGWLASPGHRENLERPTLNAIGTAVVTGGAMRTYTTQLYGLERWEALTALLSRSRRHG